MEERPGSGLVQMGARWYWPELGRFMEQDPEGEGMNWYAYAENNPLVYIDPAGEWPSWGGIKRGVANGAKRAWGAIKAGAAAIWTGANEALNPAPIDPDVGTALAKGCGAIGEKYCWNLLNDIQLMQTRLGNLAAAQRDPEYRQLQALFKQRCWNSAAARSQ